MHKAYNLDLTVERDKKYDIGLQMYKEFKSTIDSNLAQYRLPNGNLDGTKLSASWFPSIKTDVFISHSHKDFETALTLAGWLYEKHQIISFIDECVWGYSNDLLKAIDKSFCYNSQTELYDYDLRNLSTSHVHMMLSVALSRMIYNTECLFFLNTPNSVRPKDIITPSTKAETISPWIYAEIEMSRLVEKRTPDEHRRVQKSRIMDSVFSDAMPDISYDINTVHLTPLDFDIVKEWLDQDHPSKFEALNSLYSSV